MEIVQALQMLMSGEQVTLGDIASKIGIPVAEVEQEIIAALAANPTLGSYNTFTSTFTRGAPPIKKRKWWLIPIILVPIIMYTIVMLPTFFGG